MRLSFTHLDSLRCSLASLFSFLLKNPAFSSSISSENTARKRFDVGSEEESLKVSVKISEAITSIVDKITVQPSFIIAKGGITSSDVGTKGLHVKKANVLGQIKPGIPVWQTGAESKFPYMTYIIFPGNVGTETTLREIVEDLDNQKI